eukprot:gene17832-biopygen2981
MRSGSSRQVGASRGAAARRAAHGLSGPRGAARGGDVPAVVPVPPTAPGEGAGWEPGKRIADPDGGGGPEPAAKHARIAEEAEVHKGGGGPGGKRPALQGARGGGAFTAAFYWDEPVRLGSRIISRRALQGGLEGAAHRNWLGVVWAGTASRRQAGLREVHGEPGNGRLNNSYDTYDTYDTCDTCDTYDAYDAYDTLRHVTTLYDTYDTNDTNTSTTAL